MKTCGLKKLLLSWFAFIVFAAFACGAVGFTAGGTVFAEEQTNPQTDEEPPEAENIFEAVDTSSENLAYEYFKAFVTAHPDRTFGESGETAATESLAEALASMGYTPAGDDGTAFMPFRFEEPVTEKTKSSRNVIFTKKGNSGSGENVVIAAHYDNPASMTGSDGKIIGGEGAIDNATGVGALLAAAYLLKDADLEFDLVFVLFGAELPGLYGSKHYSEELGKAGRDKILVMFDFNMIGGGDYLYMYDDEVPTGHGKFIKATADSLKTEIKLPPANKKITNVMLDGLNGIIPYTHIGLLSDSAVFIAKGVNIAHFFGYNWEVDKISDGRESASRGNVVYTNRDTLANFEENYKASGIKHMNDAVRVTVAAVTADGFAEAARNSKKNTYDYSVLVSSSYIGIITASVLAAVIAAVVIIWFYLKKKEAPPPAVSATPENGGYTVNPFAQFGDKAHDGGEHFVFPGAHIPEKPEKPFDEFD
ncbi:MAG: M28 family peptidase [Clostridiales bacterium]|jgi:flagellar basal body-associated protein FliL|nr:M28 family peptidase [Clostridiales bacterium]